MLRKILDNPDTAEHTLEYLIELDERTVPQVLRLGIARTILGLDDARNLTSPAVAIPLPRNTDGIPYPFDRDIPKFASPADTTWTQAPLGCALGRPGVVTGAEFRLDLASAPHTLPQGLLMSGKSVSINAFA